MTAIVAISQVKQQRTGSCHSGAVAWFFYYANRIEINKDVADPQNGITDIFRGKRWASLRSALTYDI